MKKTIFIILVFISLFLCACQQNPEKVIVTSKNNGSLDISILSTADTPVDPDTKAPISVHFEKIFSSTDGTVQFRMNINDQFEDCNTIIEISPYFITEADAERVANVLFDNSPLYETHELVSEEQFSKSEILEKINRWSKYANKDSISRLFGWEREDVVENIKKFIEKYTLLYESAPDVREKQLCNWTFKKSSYYMLPEEEITESAVMNDNDKIMAEVTVNGIRYTYHATKRNLEDYKLSRIAAFIDDETSPNSIDNKIYYALLCRTEKPTNEQLENMRSKTQQLLSSMELGEWYIDQCYVETKSYGEDEEYIIHVTAVPVLNGIPVIRFPQLSNLTSSELYASNYYLSDVEFQYSPSGELLKFELYSPVDVKKVINSNASVLPVDELIAKAEEHLSLCDSAVYGLDAEMKRIYSDTKGEEVCVFIDICQVNYGLTRIKVPNTDDSYYYIPGLILYGAVEYRGMNTGTTYFSSRDTTAGEELIPLLALNCVDGSIIELSNG